MTVTLNQEHFDRWIAELRSGVKQGGSKLGDENAGYCCLGVMMRCIEDVRVAPYVAGDTEYYNSNDPNDGSTTGLFIAAWRWLFDGIPAGYHPGGDLEVDFTYRTRDGDHGLSAMLMNDQVGLSFEEIADVFQYFGPKTPVILD